MSVYFIPALISLIFKLLILLYIIRGGKVSTVFLCLIVSFGILNIIELVGYLNASTSQSFELVLRFYYSVIVLAIMFMLLYSLKVAKLEYTAVITSLAVVATGIVGLIFSTDMIIAGQYSIGYSISAELGNQYWIFAVFLFSSLIASIGVCVYGINTAKKHLDSVRCIYTLIALCPVLLVFFLSTVFKLTQVNVNATGFLAMATTLFLAIVLVTESKHKLSDIRRFLPMSPERKTTNRLMDLLDDYVHNENRPNAYRELQEKIEREVVSYSLKRCDNNVSIATKMMGLKNRSSLYSLIQRLDINLQELKVQNDPSSIVKSTSSKEH